MLRSLANSDQQDAIALLQELSNADKPEARNVVNELIDSVVTDGVDDFIPEECGEGEEHVIWRDGDVPEECGEGEEHVIWRDGDVFEVNHEEGEGEEHLVPTIVHECAENSESVVCKLGSSPDKLVKEGWLQKEHHNILRGVSQRYCKLTGGSLELYSNPCDPSPLVRIDLEGASIDASSGHRRPSLKLDLANAVTKQNKYDHYVLRFKNADEMNEWDCAIRECATTSNVAAATA